MYYYIYRYILVTKLINASHFLLNCLCLPPLCIPPVTPTNDYKKSFNNDKTPHASAYLQHNTQTFYNSQSMASFSIQIEFRADNKTINENKRSVVSVQPL